MYKSIPHGNTKAWILLICIVFLSLAVPTVIVNHTMTPRHYTAVTVGKTPVDTYSCAVNPNSLLDAWDCGDAYIVTHVYEGVIDNSGQADGVVGKDFDTANQAILQQTLYRFIRMVGSIDHYDALDLDINDATLYGRGIIINGDGAVAMAAVHGHDIQVAYVAAEGSASYAQPFALALRDIILGPVSANRTTNRSNSNAA